MEDMITSQGDEESEVGRVEISAQTSSSCQSSRSQETEGNLSASGSGKQHLNDDFETYDLSKDPNTLCRWNLIWLYIVLFVASYPFWLYLIDATGVSQLITAIVNTLLLLSFTAATWRNWSFYFKMTSYNSDNWSTEKATTPEEQKKINHVVILPMYNEDIKVVLGTIKSIADQSPAKSSIVLNVGMEEGTIHKKEKISEVRQLFENRFKSLIFSIHPSGISGELKGACSNRNYAARQAVMHVIAEEVDGTADLLKNTVVTVCDSDTKFHHNYFENLTNHIYREPEESRYTVCWQAPLFYNISLHERWFFTRVIGILRSFFMIGFLIGNNINTMSVYSVSLKLLMESRFFHPGYQMDDILFTLSAMKSTGKRIEIRSLDVPILNGPTSGDTLWKEMKELIIQATRWTIGAAEVFHYFVVKLIRGNYYLPGYLYFCCFTYYYLFVLCAAGIIQICDLVVICIDRSQQPSWANNWTDLTWTAFKLIPLLYTYIVVFATAFYMDSVVRRMLAPKETVHPVRNVLHFLSTQIVLWGYCVIEFLAIIKIAIYGKEVCTHSISDKSALKKTFEKGSKGDDSTL